MSRAHRCPTSTRRATGPCGPDPRGRAVPHTPVRSGRRRRWLSCAAGLALGLLCASAACDGGAAERERATRAQLDELVELLRPLKKTVTSDITDRRLWRQRELLARLRAGGEPVGLAALDALRAAGTEVAAVQGGLLDVAAHAAPEQTAPLLEALLLESGPDLSLRTRAAEYLADTRPERAIELIDPLIRKTRRTRTMPPNEILVRAYVHACDSLGRSPVDALVDVATNIFQDDASRHLAVEELGKHPSQLGEQALRAILVESTGNGYVRRKAAQALRASVPQESACELFRMVAEREADLNFGLFLQSMLEDLCD